MSHLERIMQLSATQRRLLAQRLAGPSALGNERRLIACVVTAEGAAPPQPAALRAHLAATLPSYMVPTSFVVLDAWPRTPSGKVDHQTLLKLARGQRLDSEAAFAPPRNQTERAIAEIWQELLGVSRVGVNENFFDLGGHSLLLVRLQSRLRDALGLELSIVDLFRYSTVGAQAAVLRPEVSAPSVSGPEVNNAAHERAHKQRAAISDTNHRRYKPPVAGKKMYD